MNLIGKTYNKISANQTSKKLVQLIIGIGITTWLHHIYGGFIYDTVYRIVVPTLTLPILLAATFYLQYNLIKRENQVVKVLFTLIVSIFWIVAIGLIEGGYNHILKNILFFADVSKDRLTVLFPPEFGELRLFEKPNDLIFELTGIVQFFLGLLLIKKLHNFLKNLN